LPGASSEGVGSQIDSSSMRACGRNAAAILGGVMGPVVGIEVAENSDPDGFGHEIILAVSASYEPRASS